MARVSAVPILARRFLLSKASDHFLSFIAWVSVLGVALGVLALVVVTSVINGFEGELTRVITGMNGDIVLYSRAEAVADPAQIEDKVRRALGDDVQAITTAFVTELMVSGPAGVSGAVLDGIDLDTVGQVTAIPQRVISGRLAQGDGEIALASAVAEKIGASVGSEVRLIIPSAGEDVSGPTAAGHGPRPKSEDPAEAGQPKVVRLTVTGIVKMGMYEYDSKFVFAPLPSVQKYLEQPGKATAFNIRLKPGTNSGRDSDKLTDNFGYPFRSKDWAQLNKNLFYAIKLEKVVIAIILTVIVIVAAFNVVSTLMMMIHDKTKEISILKAMGFRPGQSFRLFCLIGLGMGLVGTVFGVGAGLGVNWIIRETHLIDLPADIYYIGFLPVVVRWSEVGEIALVALLIAFVATLYPGWSVSRRSPLDGIRYE